METFVAAIMLVGFGVMFRIIRLQGAVFLIAIVAVALILIPSVGQYAQHIPVWLFVSIAVILGIGLMRDVLRILFGRNVGDGVTSQLVGGMLEAIFRAAGLILRGIFRIRP